MNKQELIKAVEELPANCRGLRPMIDKWSMLELIKLLDEPQPIKIPQFVADVIEGAREQSPELEDALHYTWGNGTKEFTEWYNKKSNRDLFARAWLDGYEIEKEKRYFVKAKSIGDHNNYLKYNTNQKHWYFGSRFIYVNDVDTKIHHTRKQLEEADFGWVFDCPGIEIEEVE